MLGLPSPTPKINGARLLQECMPGRFHLGSREGTPPIRNSSQAFLVSCEGSPLFALWCRTWAFGSYASVGLRNVLTNLSIILFISSGFFC